MSYALLDSGNQEKLERFGEYIVRRPCSQALWRPVLAPKEWDKADAFFTRDGGNKWITQHKLPASWVVEIENIRFKISPTDFGHLGVFPEHSTLWRGMQESIRKRATPQVLNLFAYSGGATLAAAKVGARVCHLDASKGMVTWARENATLNGMQEAPIRWIVEDVAKFLTREIKRGSKYDGIILDPPSFGRGSKGEIFKIESDLQELLAQCRRLLSDDPLFVIFSSHTPGFTPVVMHHLMFQMMEGVKGSIETGEMNIPAKQTLELPCGSYAKWTS